LPELVFGLTMEQLLLGTPGLKKVNDMKTTIKYFFLITCFFFSMIGESQVNRNINRPQNKPGNRPPNRSVSPPQNRTVNRPQNSVVNKKNKADKPRFSQYIDLTLTMGIPMEGFANTTTSLPFGLTFNYLYQPQNRLPFAFGGGLTYLSAGSRTVNKDLTADITVGNTLIDQLIIPLEFRISNQILNTHAVFRTQATGKYFRPFFDIYAGFSYFWTSTSLFDRSDQGFFRTTNDNNLIFRQTQSSSITWNLGAGAGFQAFVGRNTYINLNASYMLGGAVDYYDKSQIDTWNIQLNSSSFNPTETDQELNKDDVDFNAIPKRSRTPMIFASAGVTFLL
jgi:hypothetical protein